MQSESAMDIIEIENLRLRSLIGFSSHELRAPQDIVIGLRIGCERRLAGESDDPAHALNYRIISKAVIKLVETSRYALVEKLAEDVARAITVDHAAAWVEVSVRKPGALRRSDTVGIRIRRRPEDFARNIAFLSLGSNIAPERHMAAAIALLRRYTTLLDHSPVYRTAPQGYRRQAQFLNMAVRIHSLREPAEFKTEVIDRIESELGRVRDPANKNAPRTIDIDLALWNDSSFSYGARPWKVPDPDIIRFAHVAVPLADIAPDFRHPETDRTLRQIADGFRTEELEQADIDLKLPAIEALSTQDCS